MDWAEESSARLQDGHAVNRPGKVEAALGIIGEACVGDAQGCALRSRGDRPWRLSVLPAFEMETLALDDTFHVCAVVNGVTTATVTTTNPDATITSIVDTSQMERGYFTLEVG